MSITYTYEISSVDETARCMEIIYSSEGRQTMRVGARLPFDGESLESVINVFAPVSYWLEQEAAIVVPEVGTTGTVFPADLSGAESVDTQANAEMWAQLQFEKQVAKALVKFGVLQSDPTEIGVTQL